MGFLVIFIQKAIGQGIGILYGALGEMMTEKSGNLNLGIPGMMYMGGIAGLIGAFLYENGTANPSGLAGLLISFVCAFVCAALGGLVYSVLTITLRANQNVTGLALTTFGVGFGNFFGGSLAKLAGGVGQISVAVTGAAYKTPVPGLSKLGVIGQIFFSYGFLTYLAVVLALALAFFLAKTRRGLNLPWRRYQRPGRVILCYGILRRYLDQQRIWRQRLAGNRPGYFRPVETGQCHLGFYPVWRPVHPLPVYTGPGQGGSGDIQGPSLCGHHCGPGYNQPEKEEGIPAAPEPGTSVFQGRTVGI